MNLKQIYMYIASLSVVALILFCFLAGISITISPFRIEFNNLLNAIAWLMIIGGVSLGFYDASNRAKEEGYKEALKDIKENVEMIYDGVK